MCGWILTVCASVPKESPIATAAEWMMNVRFMLSLPTRRPNKTARLERVPSPCLHSARNSKIREELERGPDNPQTTCCSSQLRNHDSV